MACPNRTSRNPLQQPRTVSTLEHHIKSLESNFDHCQEAKLKSEMSLDDEPFDFKISRRRLLVGMLEIGG